MRYEITKLDYRHNHRTRYQFMIRFSTSPIGGTGALDFDRARRWFNQTYGWAQEAEIQMAMNQQSRAINAPPEENLHWAYQTEYRDYRIYVASDKELAWFQLAHVRKP
jgi:hypothetical protein